MRERERERERKEGERETIRAAEWGEEDRMWRSTLTANAHGSLHTPLYTYILPPTPGHIQHRLDRIYYT
jgi:hypothetical protein